MMTALAVTCAVLTVLLIAAVAFIVGPIRALSHVWKR